MRNEQQQVRASSFDGLGKALTKEVEFEQRADYRETVGQVKLWKQQNVTGKGTASAKALGQGQFVFSQEQKGLSGWSVQGKSIFGDFPGGTVDRNPPAKAGDTGWILSPRRFHTKWSNQACAPQLQSPLLKFHLSGQGFPESIETGCPYPLLLTLHFILSLQHLPSSATFSVLSASLPSLQHIRLFTSAALKQYIYSAGFPY